MQLAGIRGCVSVLFALLLQLGPQLLDARHDLFANAELNAAKEISQGDTEDRRVGERGPEWREVMAFFVTGHLRAIVRTEQECYFTLGEAGSPAV